MFLLAILSTVFLNGCLTGRKLDRQVAKVYSHRIPPVTSPKHAQSSVSVTSPLRFNAKAISSSAAHTSRVLPLIFYWQMDYTNTCILNPAIAVNEFTNAFRSYARRRLDHQLNGRELRLSIEKAPHGFAIDDMSHMIWCVAYYGWERVTLVPQTQDMVVAYTVLDSGAVVKQGEITVENKEHGRRLGYFESWKKATTTYIARYNHDIAEMARECVGQLENTLQ
jgi:hypothetical protein